MAGTRLSRGETLIAVAGAALFAGTFSPWFRADLSDSLKSQLLASNPTAHTTQAFSAWDAGAFWGIAGVLGLVAAAFVLLPHLVDAPGTAARALSTSAIVAAVVAGLLVLLKFGVGATIGITGATSDQRVLAERLVDVRRSWGLLLSAVVAVVLLVGAAVRYEETKRVRGPRPVAHT